MPYKLDKPQRLEMTEALKALQEMDDLCVKGANCGFDMRAHDLLAQELRKQVDAIMRNFGPPRVKE